MKSVSPLLLIFSWFLVSNPGASTELSPGLTYNPAREKLSGKLVFQLTDPTYRARNTNNQSTIYEFDLREQKLKAVVRAPAGMFVASSDDSLYCILVEGASSGTSAFIYSPRSQESRTVDLGSPSRRTAIISGHVFFALDSTSGTRILNYDAAQAKQQVLEIPGANPHSLQSYLDLHVGGDATQMLHFAYLGDAETRLTGNYSLDVNTGKFDRLSEDDDSEVCSLRSSGSNYVFFEGSERPRKGLKLMSSPSISDMSRDRGDRTGRARVLHRFSNLSAFTGGAYWLQGMSPCRRYAFVRLNSTGGPSEGSTYYLVDATNGDTRVLLKDRVVLKKAGFMSEVFWIRDQCPTK